MENTPNLVLNGTVLTGGFNVQAPRPLDAKAVVGHMNHLDQLVADELAYVGMVVYVNSDDNTKGLYVCTSLDDNGVWSPVGGKYSEGTNIDITNGTIALEKAPNVDSLGVGATTNPPVSLQYDPDLRAIKFVFK